MWCIIMLPPAVTCGAMWCIICGALYVVVHYMWCIIMLRPAAAKIDAWKLYKASLPATAFFQGFSLQTSLEKLPFLPRFVSIFEIQIPEFLNIYISVSAHSSIQSFINFYGKRVSTIHWQRSRFSFLIVFPNMKLMQNRGEWASSRLQDSCGGIPA